MEAGAQFTVPPAKAGTRRTLFFFRGDSLVVEDQSVPGYHAVHVAADQEVSLTADEGPCEVLLLQGRPIGEPVAQHGPFVMSNPAEIRQAFIDYHETQFGGWPWPSDAPVHARERGRFARHADGREEEGPA